MTCSVEKSIVVFSALLDAGALSALLVLEGPVDERRAINTSKRHPCLRAVNTARVVYSKCSTLPLYIYFTSPKHGSEKTHKHTHTYTRTHAHKYI